MDERRLALTLREAAEALKGWRSIDNAVYWFQRAADAVEASPEAKESPTMDKNLARARAQVSLMQTGMDLGRPIAGENLVWAQDAILTYLEAKESSASSLQ